MALLVGAFLPDRSDHEAQDSGHLHFFDHSYMKRLLRSAGFRIIHDVSDLLGFADRRHIEHAWFVPRGMRSLICLIAEKLSFRKGER